MRRGRGARGGGGGTVMRGEGKKGDQDLCGVGLNVKGAFLSSEM